MMCNQTQNLFYSLGVFTKIATNIEYPKELSSIDLLHRCGIRLFPGHQGVAEDGLLQVPGRAGDVARVTGEAGFLVVGLEQMGAVEPVDATRQTV